MAATEKPVNALDFAKRMIKNMNIETIDVKILNAAGRHIWMASPWRWTIGTLSAIPLVSSQQDYTLAPPGDFLYAIHGIISNGLSQRTVEIIPSLPTNVLQSGQTGYVSYQGSNTFRFYPIPVVEASPVSSAILWYKKVYPAITKSTQYTAGTLVMDDEWYHVYEAAVLWYAYLYADDQRAGGATFEPGSGRSTFTGQRAVLESLLQEMREREKLPEWSYRLAPAPKAINK